MIQKPFLKWVGGKTQILDDIVNKFPSTIENYHEIFLGGGSVLFAILSMQKEKKIIIKQKIYAYDLNSSLIYTYINVQKNKEKLYQIISDYMKIYNSISRDNGNRKPTSLKEAKESKESYYYWLRHNFNQIKDDKSVHKSALFIILNKLCFRGMYREGPNGFNVPFGNYKKTPTIISKEDLNNINMLIKDVVFINSDFRDSISKIKSKDFVYLDPPYVPENDKSFVGYTLNGFEMKMHLELFDLIKTFNEKNIKFVMSNSNTDIVSKTFEEYNCEEVIARRAINSKKPESKTKELIIFSKIDL